MINNAEFSKRLNTIINYYGESASSFAEKIGVQRSSISHILSGRNKPSLEFVLKVISSFPEVELYWLLNGKGEFPSTNNSNNKTLEDVGQITSAVTTQTKLDLNADSNSKLENHNTGKHIDRIVIFYSDGSFESFKN